MSSFRIPEKNVALGVGVGVGAVLAGWWAWRRIITPSFPHTWEEVGEVSELTIYPVKSAKGIQMMEAEATIYGLASNLLEDRSYMVMTEEGSFVSSRQAGMLATVETDLRGPLLTLRAKDFEDISVDLDQDLKDRPVLKVKFRELTLDGVDCGDAVAEWLSRVLYNDETKVRLLYKGDVVKHRPARNPDKHNFTQYRKSDRAVYTDYSSYMMASQSSLDDLNSRLTESVSMGNFRPNIVVKGSTAFDEDDWVYAKIGEVVLRRLRPCERCVLTTISPETGERHPEMEPLKTLKGYRLLQEPPALAKAWATKPLFGVIMGIDKTGPIAVGNKVFIARASVHPHLRGY